MANRSHDELFAGVAAVQQAGDLAGFARECAAEVKTRCSGRVRAGELFASTDDVAGLITDEFSTVAMRRLRPDFWREVNQAVLDQLTTQLPGDRDAVDALFASVLDAHTDRMIERCRVLASLVV